MAKDRLSRKLAVILHADVVGSTSLVQKDEALAHQRIRSVFNGFSETIGSYGGLTREIRGDALVAQFERASDAVSASLKFQKLNAELNLDLKDQIRPELRIGISLGEVIVADNTMTGEGVILAQRLEQLAEPGGVVVQGTVSETVPSRMPFNFSSQGDQLLKGFEQPVRAFVVTLKPGESLPAPETDSTPQDFELRNLQIPDELSIAVLPFTNMSTDPEQEFFSDGITEDIITALSKISALLVIARNSTFIYKGKAVDLKQVGQEQGVRNVLEGSVRKSGNRVRITAQLVDTVTGHHKWAESFDRELEDIFAVQDEITLKIVSALNVQLLTGEQGRFWSSGTENLKAWEYCRLGGQLLDSYRAEDIPEAIVLLKKAIDCDPDYASAWIVLAGCHIHVGDDARYPIEERKQAFELLRHCTEQALKCDPSCSDAYAMLGLCNLNDKKYDDAIVNANKSVKLAPNHASNYAISATILNKCGQPEIAIERIRKAMRLCPVYPMWFLVILGQIYRVLGSVDDSTGAYSEMIKHDPDHLEGHIGLANILGESDQIEKAKVSATEVLRINPNFSIKAYIGNLAYRDQAEISRFANGLRKAGLPE